MKAKIKSLIIQILGWLFILLGILGLFLPFLQGILFILIGLYLLSHQSPWAKNLLRKIRSRFPKLAKTLDQAKAKNRKFMEQFFKRKPIKGQSD
ncbi:MAG: tellurium resistance protein TerC [Clostridia bacterium]|nr:tellurium resistance protein TerC [Clostridia bacterium]